MKVRRILGHAYTPRLDELIKSGVVRSTPFCYEGMASDGVIVTLGHMGEEVAIEAYLCAYPSPEEW